MRARFTGIRPASPQERPSICRSPKGEIRACFIGAALPVLGASYYRTREVTGLPTVSGSPDRQNGGSGEVQVRTLDDHEFRRDCRANRCAWAGCRNNGAEWFEAASTGLRRWRGRRSISTLGPWCRPGTCGLASRLRNLREPEFQAEGGMVRMKRQFRVGAALAPRALPTGVHGPFSLAIDADLTTTPDVQGRPAHGGGRRRVLAGEGACRCARRACGGAHWAIRAGRSRAGLR